MNMASQALNAAAGGPVGGMMMINNNGGSPAVQTSSEKGPEQIKVMLNTYVYEYFLKLRYYDIARVLAKDDKFEFRTNEKSSPGHRKDGEVNGVDRDLMDAEAKDDIPDDLPRPAGASAEGSMQGNGFLFEWFSVFSDLFAAHRSSKSGNPTPAMQYLIQHQQMQRMRESQQNQNLARPGAMLNHPNFLRNQQLQRGMVNGEMAKNRLTPQQISMMQQQQGKAQMAQMNRDGQADGDPNRPATPADGENGGSPSKRPRLEANQQFNGAMIPNGRPAGPGVGQQGMLMQTPFPNNMNPAQFRNGMPPKAMGGNMANGMMSMPNAGSPMMQGISQFPNDTMDYQRGMAMQGMQGVPSNGNGSGNHALQDYQMQLMLLEQQNKKRLMMARQEQHESTNPRDGQPMAGVNMQPGMSPSGSRTGTSPNPTDQMKRTPQLGGMPGSPSAGEMAGRSPAPMGFMNGMPPNEFNTTMFMKDGQMMGPGGPAMRPPTSVEMNAMNRPPQQGQQQPQGRMQFQGGQPMQQQPSQGQPQPVGTPGQGQRDMPPPQAPAAGNVQRGNQPASPATSNAPPTPSQANKANPKKKNNNKDGPDKKQRPTKKNSTANAPNADENPPATPTSSTPLTPVHGGQFNNSGGKGPNQGHPSQQPNAMQAAQPTMPAPETQNTFPDFSAPDNFNLDFSTLENHDVLENFDFDSFLNTSNDETFNFDGGVGMGNFDMDSTE